MANKNLVEALGRDYFNERYVGALMLHDGNVVSVRGAADAGVVANVLVERGGKIIKTPPSVTIPYDRFTGFEVFKAPALGYRKIENSCYFIRQPVVRSHASAFFTDRITMTGSRATNYLQNLGGLTPARTADPATISQLYFPTYDTIGKWELLVGGEESSLVLSSKIIVEPSTRMDDDVYDILYDNVIIGTVGSTKKPRARTPAFNVQLINRILS